VNKKGNIMKHIAVCGKYNRNCAACLSKMRCIFLLCKYVELFSGCNPREWVKL